MRILQYGIIMMCVATLAGCSKGNSEAPVTIDPVTKKHPAGWASNGTGGAHTNAYFAIPGGCEECHGKPSDAAGGISKVSCSNQGRSGVACHANFPHVAGFSSFSKHGSVARDVASGITGMAHCQKCHGDSYTGAGLAPDCIGCHKGTNTSSNAPHAAKWVSGNANGLKHSAADVSNAAACAQCHLGGRFSHAASSPAVAGAVPGCFNGTLCHNTAGHALPYVDGHKSDAKANLAGCQTCHATPFSGSNPRFNLPKGGGVLKTAGCEGCHSRPGLAHPYMWLPGRGGSTTSHANAGTVNVSCGLCHGGAALTGGGVAHPGGIVPPSCFSNPRSSINGISCHITKPVDNQGVDVGCISCHGNPPATNKHGSHFTNIPNITCAACHNNQGPGIATHADSSVNVALSSTYQAKTGGFAIWNSARCANVSCHGGQTTVPWITGAININTDCNVCHISGTSQYNSYNSGEHNKHVSAGVACVACHDTAALAVNHFTHLETQIMEGPAYATIGGARTSVTSYNRVTGSCSPSSTGFCHNTRNW